MIMAMRAPLATFTLGMVAGCVTRVATSPESKVDRMTLQPSLHRGERFTYRVDATIEAVTGGQPAKATLLFDDEVEAVSAAEVRETFANVTTAGDGELGEALMRIAAILPSTSVTTWFDGNWQVASSSIDGTQDDEARTMIMNLTPVVSFKMLPKDPVAVGETWTSQWSEALRSDSSEAAGKVATRVRYRLTGIAACGPRRCATIVGDGKDTITAHGGITGASTFHGEQQVDLTNAVPLEKTIESKTTVQGVGQPYEYTNTANVHVRRTDSMTTPSSPRS